MSGVRDSGVGPRGRARTGYVLPKIVEATKSRLTNLWFYGLPGSHRSTGLLIYCWNALSTPNVTSYSRLVIVYNVEFVILFMHGCADKLRHSVSKLLLSETLQAYCVRPLCMLCILGQASKWFHVAWHFTLAASDSSTRHINWTDTNISTCSPAKGGKEKFRVYFRSRVIA